MIGLTFWLAVANLAQLLLGVGRLAILTRWLGVEMMGRLGYLLALVVIADTIAQAGLSTVLTRDVAAAPRRDGALFGAVLAVRGALSVVAGIVIGVLAGPWAGLMVLTYVGQLGVVVLRAKLLRGPQIAASLLPPALSLLAVAFISASRDPSADLALAALAASALLAAGGQVWLAIENLKRPLSFSLRTAAGMLGAAWPFWLAGLTVVVLYRLDVLMLKWLLGGAEGERAIGYYWPATMVVESGSFLLGALSMVAFPAMAKVGGAAGRNPRAAGEVGKVYARALKWAVILGGVACLFAYPFAPLAVRIVAGREFGPSVTGLYLLAPTLLLVLVNSTSASLLTVLHRPFTILKITTAGMVFNALLNLWAIPRWGFAGAAATTTAAEALGMLLLLGCARRALGVSCRVHRGAS